MPFQLVYNQIVLSPFAPVHLQVKSDYIIINIHTCDLANARSGRASREFEELGSDCEMSKKFMNYCDEISSGYSSRYLGWNARRGSCLEDIIYASYQG